jgi:predicted esterase
MPVKKCCLLFLLAGLIEFCYSQKNRTKEIVASSDSTQKFSLCLPNAYTENKKYPLIIFFDPAARGNLPVSLYSDLADTYNIILACSFNSRNFDNNSSGAALQAMYNDLASNYAVDKSSIFLAGFSGGSRAASQLAIENNGYFHGIIACGAGFSDEKISPDYKIPYAAIVGNKDMNYSELLKVNEYLDSINNDNILITTETGHDWPPSEYMELAIVWLLEKRDSSEKFAELKNKWMQYAMQKIKAAPSYATYFDLKQLRRIQAFNPEMDSLLKTIPQNKTFNKDKRKFYESLDRESSYAADLTETYSKAMRSNSIDSIKEEDWFGLLREINAMQKNKDKYIQLAGTRCLDKSVRICIEYSMVLLQSGQFPEAYNTAHILSFFSPQNFNSYFFMAEAAAGLNDKKLAAQNLKMSVQKGMTNQARAFSDSLLLKVFNKEELKIFF